MEPPDLEQRLLNIENIAKRIYKVDEDTLAKHWQQLDMQNVVDIFHRNAALPFIMAIDERGPPEEQHILKLPIYRYIE